MTTPTLPPSPEGPQGPVGWPIEPAATPRCYRHPDRESYIRCQRCNRPICPDCQIPAAVGFQCPECVREGSKTVRPARTALGGVIPRGDGAIVTKTIIALNAAVFLAQNMFGETVDERFGMVGHGVPAGSRAYVGIADGEYYRLITAAFLHGGLAHIAINMLSLWLLGPPLEQALGRARFVALYLLGAIGGSAVSYLFNPPNIIGLGASGAIFALFGALLPISRKLRQPLSPYFAMLALNAAIGFLAPNIDWKAHLGGLFTGIALGAAVAYAPRKRRGSIELGVVLGVVVLIIGIVVFRTQQLTG